MAAEQAAHPTAQHGRRHFLRPTDTAVSICDNAPQSLGSDWAELFAVADLREDKWALASPSGMSLGKHIFLFLRKETRPENLKTLCLTEHKMLLPLVSCSPFFSLRLDFTVVPNCYQLYLENYIKNWPYLHCALSIARMKMVKSFIINSDCCSILPFQAVFPVAEKNE